MKTTSVSLLDRLRGAGPDDANWLRLQQIYHPLIRRWLARLPGLEAEADDLAQEVFLVIIREVNRFERRRAGSFRTWLRQVTVNQVRTFRRRRQRRPTVGGDPVEGFLDELSDPDGELAREWDADHDRHVLQKLLSIVQSDFHRTTWEAFQRSALDGSATSVVAKELGLTVNAVLQAKSRVLKRLREEAGDLLG